MDSSPRSLSPGRPKAKHGFDLRPLSSNQTQRGARLSMSMGDGRFTSVKGEGPETICVVIPPPPRLRAHIPPIPPPGFPQVTGSPPPRRGTLVFYLATLFRWPQLVRGADGGASSTASVVLPHPLPQLRLDFIIVKKPFEGHKPASCLSQLMYK